MPSYMLSQTPEIVDISFNKGQRGMGLSIVAAKVSLNYFFTKKINKNLSVHYAQKY